MWRLLLFLAILKIAHTSCPDGFDLVRKGQCRGLVDKASVPGNQATDMSVTKCKEIGSQPVIIHDEEDQTYWTNIAVAHENFILGIVCNTNTKRWEWADGSQIDYKPATYNSDLNGSCTSEGDWELWPGGYWAHPTSSSSYLDYFFCTKQLPPLPIPCADGCDNFEDDGEDGVCYQIGATAENWQEAQMICRSFGAEVASIHNLQENSFIRRLAVSHSQVTGLYLGATLSGKGNDFSWIDGSKWDYANFYPGFPMSGLGDCLMMDTESAAGQWVNVGCSTKLSVACMRKQHNAPPPDCSAGPWQEGQIIYSPGFPFDASVPCDFILSVDAEKKVEVEVLFLEANSCCDQLVLFENYFGGTVVANLTGEVSDKKFTTSSSNFMRVSWRPTEAVNVKGVMFTYRGV